MHSPVDGLSTPEPRHQPRGSEQCVPACARPANDVAAANSRDVNLLTDADALAEEDQWLDEVLSQTFPASDPVPRRHKDVASNAGDEPD